MPNAARYLKPACGNIVIEGSALNIVAEWMVTVAGV